MFRRRHPVEIHEQPWCRRSLRDGVTDAVGFFSAVGRGFEVVKNELLRAIRESGTEQVVDLCSGAGGPWLALERALDGSPVRVVLTDLHPNEEAFRRAGGDGKGRIQPHPEPVDARAVPAHLGGFRTLFTISARLRHAGSSRTLCERAGASRHSKTGNDASVRCFFFLLYIPLSEELQQMADAAAADARAGRSRAKRPPLQVTCLVAFPPDEP